MHFGFTLDSSDIGLWNTRFVRYTFRFLDTDKFRKRFACLQDVLQTSSRHVFKISSRHAFKTFPRHVFKTSSTRLQRNNFSSSKTSWGRLEDVLEDEKLLRWRRPQDVLKICLEDVMKTCLEDALKTCLEDISWRRLEDVSKAKKFFTGDICI